ncbi:MAG: 2Fe-2S iron-sulfur cluster-binding protein [Halobacteria archaeon]|nr:2Fe-2S iron-sulfur cluster-binding protein [Halobacteria archaeon]
MESTTVEPDALERTGDFEVPDELRDAIEEEMEFLEPRNVKLVRLRARENSNEVFQATIYAGDEMYRLSVVAPGHVSRTVFRNPERLDVPDEEEEEGEVEEEVIEEDIPDEEKEKTYQVELVKEGETIEVQGDEYILDAAEDEGFDLPYSCREGQCVACSAKVEGKVDQPRAQAIGEEEMSEGYVLTCIGMPREDLKVWTNEKP